MYCMSWLWRNLEKGTQTCSELPCVAWSLPRPAMTTSESPPLASIKRLKSKPTQRTRPSSPDPELTANHDEQTSAVSRSSSPSVLAAKLKSKVKKAQPKSRLSFGGADDEEVRVSLRYWFPLIIHRRMVEEPFRSKSPA